MSRPFLLAAAAAMALSACAMNTGMSGEAATDLTPEGRDAYVEMAAASDMFEIQSSQLALTKAQRAEVRAFAQMMIDHHTGTSQQLMAAAQAAGVAVAPQMTPAQMTMVSQLQGQGGAGFDRLYMGQQVRAHRMALALHSNYASDGDTPALRTVAAAATPIVRQHLTRAQQLD